MNCPRKKLMFLSILSGLIGFSLAGSAIGPQPDPNKLNRLRVSENGRFLVTQDDAPKNELSERPKKI